MARELSTTLTALGDAAGMRLVEIDWPLAIINAVWAAKETPEGADDEQRKALDHVEELLAELLGVERGERLAVPDMVERLKAMRTAVDGGAVFIVGPAGLKPMRALLDGEGSPEEMEQFGKAIDAAIAVNADMEAARPAPPPHVGRNSNHGGPQEEDLSDV